VLFRFHVQVTRLLNECEKHASAGRAPFVAGVKRDLRKHVELSEVAKLWWTQLDAAPASVLHAETLAANFRAVPFTPAAAAGAEASTHATGAGKAPSAAAVADAGPSGLVMHRAHLAPALDFLLTCFRGQARCVSTAQLVRARPRCSPVYVCNVSWFDWISPHTPVPRSCREEVLTSEMRAFGEQRLEAASLLRAARTGGALDLPAARQILEGQVRGQGARREGRALK
jgi:hypothetical protein